MKGNGLSRQLLRLGACGCVLLFSLASPAMAGALRTKAILYRAFDDVGTPIMNVSNQSNGSCFTGSLAINRNDAWRCMADNFIYDPCFSSDGDPRVLLCPNAPWSHNGIEIDVSSNLTNGNTNPPSKSGTPWGIQTRAGVRYRMTTGASNAIGNVRANFAAAHNADWLWGSPSRRTQPWTIFAAPINATRLTRRAKIRIAWF